MTCWMWRSLRSIDQCLFVQSIRVVKFGLNMISVPPVVRVEVTRQSVAQVQKSPFGLWLIAAKPNQPTATARNSPKEEICITSDLLVVYSIWIT